VIVHHRDERLGVECWAKRTRDGWATAIREDGPYITSPVAGAADTMEAAVYAFAYYHPAT
jgi:hypothetical protein